MQLVTAGTYRVFPGRGDDAEGELLLIDVEDYDPIYVRPAGPANACPGYLVDATLAWDDEGTPRITDLDVRKRTLVEFVDGVTGVFEAARETWMAAEAENEAMNARVTRNTDGDPNGVLYVFAKQPGARDLFCEFRDGVRPLEPLLERVNERDDRDRDREVFVMRPRDEPFVLVYIALEKGGILADTVRDTYDCPRPAE